MILRARIPHLLGILITILSLTLLRTADVYAGANGTSSSRVISLSPSGTDDTLELQSALDACSGSRAPCVLSLGEGEFRTAPLVARHFHGVIRGAGMGVTTVRTLTDRVLHLTKASPLNTQDPTPSEPWPAIITFFEGDILISDMTIFAPLGTKTDGWHPVCLPPSASLVPTLSGALWFTGRSPMNVLVRHVAFEGAPDPSDTFVGFTLVQSVIFGGFLLPAAYQDTCLDRLRIQGRFVDEQNSHSQMPFGPFLVSTDRVLAVFSMNQYAVAVDALQLYELSRTRVVAANNTANTISGSGIVVFQNTGTERTPSGASDFAFTHNTINVSGAALAGIGYLDVATNSPPVGLLISDNRVSMGAASSAAIGVSGAVKGPVVLKNRVAGSSDSGIFIDRSNGCRVIGTDFSAFSAENPDIVLGSGSRDCTVVASSHDTVIDQGTNNHLILH